MANQVKGRHAAPGERQFASESEFVRPAFARRLSLDQAGCVAGAVIFGHVALDDDATVELLRHERVPHGEYVFKIVEARPSRSDGTFALSVPDQMLPSATGERCELRYSVSARSDREADRAPFVVTASARPHLAGDPFPPIDR
jgi:hypothetical protein